MAEMDVTARFRADTSDFTKNVNAMNRLYKDSAGKWRDESGKFANAAQRAAAGVGGMGDEAKKSSKGFTVLRGAIGTAIGGAAIGAFYAATSAIKNFATGAVQAAVEARLADDRIKAIATSMGVLDTTLGGSTQRILDFASELQAQTGVSDEVIKQGQAIILTFKDVAASAGESGGMFDRATAAAVDLAAAGFGGVEQNAKSLARALQDPLKGLTMLGRQGVTFTEAEKEKIKALVESGNLLKAQEIIMGAVETQVGGTAAATMTAGDKMRVAFDEFQEVVGKAVLPIIERVQLFIAERIVPALERFVGYLQANVFPVAQKVFSSIVEFVQQAVGRFVSLYNAVVPIAPLFAPIAAGILAMVAAWKLTNAIQAGLTAMRAKLVAVKAQVLLLNAAILANPIVAIAAVAVGAIAALGVAFKMVYDRSEVLRKAVSDVVNVFKTVASVIFGDLISAFSGLFGSQKKAGSGMSSVGDIMQRVADIAGPILAKGVNILGGAFKVIGNIIRIQIKAFEILVTVFKMIANIIRTVVIVVVQKLGSIFSGLLDKMGPVGDFIQKFAGNVARAFSNVPKIISSAVQSAVGFLEGAINGAIGAINFLIRAYNKIPFVTQIAELEAFRFDGFTASADAAASSANNVANAVGGYASQAMRGNAVVDAGVSSQNGLSAATDETTESLNKAGSAGSKTDKVLEGLKKKVDQLKGALAGASEALKVMGDMAERRFGEESAIEKAFGTEGDISSAIGAYDQLDAALNQYYGSLLKAPGLTKKVSNALRAERDAQRATLRATVENQIRLYKQREKIQKDMEDLERAYEKRVNEINAHYDRAEKAAEENIKRIESYWAAVIPGLEKALKDANDAFERENSILQGLIQQRDAFLGQVSSSFRSFVNQLSFGDDPGASDIRAVLEDRLNAVREFATNIRTLVARGLDPTLVQEFITAGVSGAGQAAAALAAGSQAEIEAINQVQSGLASEIAAFGEFGAQQWYNAGIAQQEAIVAPLRIAAEQAQMALDMANVSRDAELVAARAHAEQLKIDRQAALEQARSDYNDQNNALKIQMDNTNKEIAAGALALQEQFTNLRNTLPIQMHQIGYASSNMILRGFRQRYPHIAEQLNAMMDRLAASMNRVATVTVRTVYENVNLPGRALGGPVAASKAYIVGERGPEVFVPGMSGNILPNNMLGRLGTAPVIDSARAMGVGGGDVTNITINVQTGIATDPAETGRQVVEAIRRYERRSGQVFVSA